MYIIHLNENILFNSFNNKYIKEISLHNLYGYLNPTIKQIDFFKNENNNFEIINENINLNSIYIENIYNIDNIDNIDYRLRTDRNILNKNKDYFCISNMKNSFKNFKKSNKVFNKILDEHKNNLIDIIEEL